MRKFHKSLSLLSLLGLGLGFSACSSEKDAPEVKNTPGVVVPSESSKLTAEEAKVNTNSISILRSAEQAGLKIKQISSLPTGQVGYNVLLSDERLVKVYTATGNTARVLRAAQSTMVENPIKSVDLGTKGIAVFNLADGSKITLNRVGANDQGVLAVDQSVAPESKFLFGLLHGEQQLLAKVHTPVKSVVIKEAVGTHLTQVVYNEMGYLTRMQETWTISGSSEPNQTELVIHSVGERVMTIEYTDRESYNGKTHVTMIKLVFDYNQANQAIPKSLVINGKDRELQLEYKPLERKIVSTSLDDMGNRDKAEFHYDEYFRLVKEVDYSKKANDPASQWEITDTTIYTYDSRGDLKTEDNGEAVSNYVYEYDAKGNWTKRTGAITRKDGLEVPSEVVTREITY